MGEIMLQRLFRFILLLVAFVAFVPATGNAVAAEQGQFRAGAARVDITPAPDAALSMSGYAGRKHGHDSIHDKIYLRALVLDDGARQTAIVTFDVIAVPNDMWEELSQKIARELNVPRENVLLAGVHTHGAPSVGKVRPGGQPDPKTVAYTDTVEAAALEAVRQAKSRLQPARSGAGTGSAYVNINRREHMADGRWWLGYNPDGVSDKTVAVIKFESQAGEPIAFLINYSVHGTIMDQDNYQITGDLPGATSRFVEEYYKQKAVALWTSSAAGDQNPVARAKAPDFTLVSALGQILGEEAVRVAKRITTSPRGQLFAAQRVVTCPGQKALPGARPRSLADFQDAEPVDIRLSLLMIDRVALAGVSGEVLTMINQRLKKESPFANTLMLTHCNGSSGYLPDDAAYDQVSYEIMTTRVKRGCAENAIVNGFLDMMRQQ